MQRGIALLNESTSASLDEAIAFFDRAIALRREEIVAGDHWAAYLLAASWMNRGDALTRLVQTGHLAEAVRSYDEALLVLRGLPLEENPLYRRRHAIAWMNRGITFLAEGTAPSARAAVESFTHSIALVTGHSEHALLLACAWMNRGNAHLRLAPPEISRAYDAALAAVRLVAAHEREDALAGETGLKARHILCQACAELIETGTHPEGLGEFIAVATDAVEEGLNLGRHWEAKGDPRFRPLLTALFRFGVAVYRAHQPQFLGEFVLENLDPLRPDALFAGDREVHAHAVRGLECAALKLPPDGFSFVTDPRFDQLIENLRALRVARERLQGLDTAKLNSPHD
jgi:hypothetical protein